ncbi:MAG: adenylate/guanylate cyclase domain-containing protein [Bacteroidales bacterium]|jgi:adenylate cyclase|nr:adenylate/guanylate cyclase domain-containing protein [Bacteroidales bacterium]
MQKGKPELLSVKEAFNIEITKSERLRAIILIGLLGLEAVFLLVIYFFYSEEYLQMFESNIAIYAILIFTFVLIVYESLIHYFVGKKPENFLQNSHLFSFINGFSEVTLLSLLLVFIVEYSNQTTILQSPATLTYFIFIALSTFRLDFKLSVFTGALAAIEYIGISIYYSTYYGTYPIDSAHPDLTGMQYLGQGLILVIAGIASGFVADLIRKKMDISFRTMNEKNEVIGLFGQQISQQIANSILENRKELTGVRKNVCVMFLDIRQFTSFVDHHQPEEVVSYLNKLFGFMIESVESHYGVINQFLGDGFMATFGAPVTVGNSSQLATETALEIIDKINTEYQNGNIPETRIGIGLHYDEAVTGNIGSSSRKQYSITGKVVIMASRIEQLNKKYNTSLLISEEVYNQLNKNTQNTFEWIEKSKVKGSEKLISLFKFVDLKKEKPL